MKTLVKTRRLLDCAGDRPTEGGCFAFEDGVITHVGRQDDFEGMDGIGAVIDLSGFCVMPGMVDSHVHLGLSHTDSIDPMPVTKQMGEPPQRKIAKAALYMRQHLDAGVTTLRSMGEEHFIDMELRRATEEGYMAGPRVICSGNVITASHGQGQIGLSAADGAEEVRRAVRRNLAMGADFIKIFVGGGVVSSEAELRRHTYNLEEISVAVAEAGMLGKYVAAHIHGGPGLDLCLRGGVRSIEHACLASDSQIEAIAEAGAWVTGTFSPAMHPQSLRLLPPDKQERLRQVQERILDVYGKLLRAGVPMSFGTDGVHGAIAFEAVNIGKCGASPMQAVRFVTAEGAKACRVEDKLGTLEVGKYADFIALEDDPLENLENLGAVAATYVGGRRMK
ncbi:MAG: amidohydrolase family protein [Clostridiales Family XIII bacterium]|jgi:imidazolonepropionase-like amidohydrolase|nr:amidohydrolase family protein [Clostridiales Family XIII bacterium]